MDKMLSMSQKEFKTVDCLPIKKRYNQCVNFIAFNYFDKQCPHYMNEVFTKAPEST